MPVLLVRHAKAGDRDAWEGPDAARPLTGAGRAQAAGLVTALAGFAIGRIVSSPYVRCTQTVEPLAAARGLEVEACDDLAEGTGSAAAALVAAIAATGAEPATVLCTHGDVVLDVLDSLVSTGVDLPAAPPLRKGSTWVLAVQGGRVVDARYLDAPAG